jgi:hypothetical protein
LCGHHASCESAAASSDDGLPAPAGDDLRQPQRQTACHHQPQALDELSDIADGFLLHNRDILQRMDDSVMDRDGAMLRRARGFVPDAITLPAGFDNIPAMLCTGAEMKNTFCLVRGNQAVLSQHFGDLGDEGVEAQWRGALSVMQDIYAFQPSAWCAMPIRAIALASGRRRRRCRLKPYCIITPTRRRAWRKTAGRSTAETLSP